MESYVNKCIQEGRKRSWDEFRRLYGSIKSNLILNSKATVMEKKVKLQIEEKKFSTSNISPGDKSTSIIIKQAGPSPTSSKHLTSLHSSKPTLSPPKKDSATNTTTITKKDASVQTKNDRGVVPTSLWPASELKQLDAYLKECDRKNMQKDWSRFRRETGSTKTSNQLTNKSKFWKDAMGFRFIEDSITSKGKGKRKEVVAFEDGKFLLFPFRRT